MKVRDILSFTAFALTFVLGAVYLASVGLRVKPPEDRINLSLNLLDTNSLVVDSNVLLRGVPVGRITGIDPTVAGAVVKFYIDNRYQIPADTDVRLANLSALGESYLEFNPRSDGGSMLRDGQVIEAANVVAPASISQLAESINRLLSQLDPGVLQSLIAEADAALPDPTVVLPNLARTSVLVRNVVADMNGEGAVLLDNFQTLLRNSEYVGPSLSKITPYLPDLGADIQRIYLAVPENVALGSPQTILDFGKLIARIQGLLDTRGGDLKVLFTELQPRMQRIAGALMNFDTGQILSNVLAAVPDDGAINLHVNVAGG